MRKYLPKIAMVAGMLLVVMAMTYALGRIWYVYSIGLPVETIKRESAWVSWFCLIVVPFGGLLILGGWLWKRNDEEVEQEKAELRERWESKRRVRPNKFTR